MCDRHGVSFCFNYWFIFCCLSFFSCCGFSFSLKDYLSKSNAYIIDCVHKHFGSQFTKWRKKLQPTTTKWNTLQCRCWMIILGISLMMVCHYSYCICMSLSSLLSLLLCDSFSVREMHCCVVCVCVSCVHTQVCVSWNVHYAHNTHGQKWTHWFDKY